MTPVAGPTMAPGFTLATAWRTDPCRTVEGKPDGRQGPAMAPADHTMDHCFGAFRQCLEHPR